MEKARITKTVLLVTGCLLFLFTSSLASDDLNSKVEILAEKLSATAEGNVIKGSETEVYIDLGRKHGILKGNRFEIIRSGDPLKMGDQIIGYEETYLGEIEIKTTRDQFSIGSLVKKEETPANGDKAYQLKSDINTLVIGQFSVNNTFNALTKSLQEKLVTAMTNRGMHVVERDQLERVLKEQKLGYSGLVDLNSAQKIGELLGAQGMLLGSVSDLGNTITINSRLVDIKTGNALAASEVELHKTPQIERLLKTSVNIGPNVKGGWDVDSGVIEHISTPSQMTLEPINFKTAQNGPLKAYVRSVNKSPDQKSVSVSLMLENTSSKKIYLSQEYCFSRSRAITLDDQQGNLFSGTMSGLAHACNSNSPQKEKIKYYSLIAPKGKFAVSFSATRKSKSKKDTFASNLFSISMNFLLHKGEEEDGEEGSYSQLSLGLFDIPCSKNCNGPK